MAVSSSGRIRPMLDQRQLAGAFSVAFVLLSLVLVERGLWKGGAFDGSKFNDFKAYHLAAEGVWRRDLRPSYEDPRRPNQYPPAFAILVAPLGLLPYRAAGAMWVLANGVTLLLIFRSLDQVLGLPLSALAKLAGFLLVFRLLESDFSNGNANLFVLGLVLLSFGLSRRGLHFTGGS